MAKPDTNARKPHLSGLTPVSTLKGMGPKRTRILNSAGILTVEDLVFYFPFRYEDRRHPQPIRSLQPGMDALVKGVVVQSRLRSLRKRGSTLFAASIKDDSGILKVTWFNQPWLADKIRDGQEVTIYGTVESQRNLHVFSMNSPAVLSGRGAGERGIVPVYQRIKDVTGTVLRQLIQQVFREYSLDVSLDLPAGIRESLGLPTVREALQMVHMPEDEAQFAELNSPGLLPRKALVFAEFFAIQAGLALLRQHDGNDVNSIRFETSEEIRETLKGMLPFTLTDGQRNAFRDIVEDMTSSLPMRRLLQGDVGSGKTIVALLAAALAIENGYQAVFMAPTEILAAQHVQSIAEHCSHTRFRTAFLTGSLSSGERRKVRQQIAEGKADIIAGTHALIQEGVTFKNLGLAVIDEQHRFGVMQRAALLKQTAGRTPDLLIMTATPIPRSLTLTLFGDLRVSQIRDKPPGRKKVLTAVRHDSGRTRIHSFLHDQIKAGRQVYWVCPRIEDNPDDEIRSAETVFRDVRHIFGDATVDQLHGRMNAAEKERAMADFVRGKTQILVATVVIEVGVNVPNATVMLIENADKFGLSQLHQLRGRVGRGAEKSYCILMQSPDAGETAQERLAILEDSDDGFVIAEKDLELRGPGDFIGTQQSGLTTFRVGNLIRDADIMETAREQASSFIEENPAGSQGGRQEYINHLKSLWKRRYGLVLAG